MLRTFTLIGARVGVFLIAVNADADSATEFFIGAVILALATGEIHDAIMHRGINVRNTIRYSWWSVAGGFFIALAGLYVGDKLRESQHETYPRFDVETETVNTSPDLLERFRLSPQEKYNMRWSDYAQALIESDADVFRKIPTETTEWLYTTRYAPTSRPLIKKLFKGFQTRVDQFVRLFPGWMVDIRAEMVSHVSDPVHADFINAEGRSLQPIYDSLLNVLKVESVQLERDMSDLAEILADRKNWTNDSLGRPIVIRAEAEQQRTVIVERALLSLQSINVCRNVFLAYYSMLRRVEGATP